MKTQCIVTKICSAVFSLVFVLTSVVIPAGGYAVTAETEPILDAGSISVPAGLGSVKKTYTAPGSTKFVIHIQDAHCNPGAQHNIAGILNNINKDYNVDLVGVEGAQSWIDTAIHNAIPGRLERERINKELVDEAWIDGPVEFAGNQEEIDAVLYGVESKELYLENLKAYSALSKVNKDAISQADMIEGAYIELSESIYNKNLLEFSKQKADYLNGIVDFADYLRGLVDLAEKNSLSLEGFPAIKTYINMYSMEGEIDFEKVDSEREELISHISNTGAKGKIEELVVNSLNFRVGKMEAADFYKFLCSIIPEGRDYPNIVKYAKYVEIEKGIDKASLFREETALEKLLEDSLVKTDTEKQLIGLSNDLVITKRLFSVKLIRDEYYRYKEGITPLQAHLSFIREHAPAHNLDFAWDRVNTSVWESCEKAGLGFYKAALKREDAFVENLVKEMDVSKLAIAGLVTGGFHTDSIEEQLRQRGISYVVIAPRVHENTPAGVYEKVMGEVAEEKLDKYTMTPDPTVRVKGRAGAISEKTGVEVPPDAVKDAQEKTAAAPDADAAKKQIDEHKDDFQASIFATKQAAKDIDSEFDANTTAKEIYNNFVAAINNQVAKDDLTWLTEDVGIAHWNKNDAKIEISTQALKFFALAVANGGFGDDGEAMMTAFITDVVLAHEKSHKDGKGEFAALTGEVTNLRRLEKAHPGILEQLKAMFFKTDTGYANGIISRALDIQILPDVVASNFLASRLRNELTRILEELEVTEEQLFVFLDLELKEAVCGEVTVPLTDGIVTTLTERGLTSVIIDARRLMRNEDLTIETIASPLAVAHLAVSWEAVDSAYPKGRRQIVTNKHDKALKDILVAEHNAVHELMARSAEITDSVILQIQLEAFNGLEEAQLKDQVEALTARLKQLKGIKGKNKQQVFYVQFIDKAGNVATPADNLAGLAQYADTEVSGIRTMRVVNAEFKGKAQDGIYYLPVSGIFDGVVVLAASVVLDEEFLKWPSIQQFRGTNPPAAALFELMYTGDIFSKTEDLRRLLTEPWLITSLLQYLLPITRYDVEELRLMRTALTYA